MKILITGGQGQVGRELAWLLRGAGVSGMAPGRLNLDITDDKALQRMIEDPTDRRPVSAVIHTAAMTQVDLCEAQAERAFTVNARATEQIARLCGEWGIPLVYLSTDFVFDGSKESPYEVGDAPAPLSVYGASKLAGEEAVRRLTDRHYVVRTAWVYGVYGHNFPRAILKAAAEGRPLSVVDDQVGAPTYARDLAEGVLALLGIGGSDGPAPCGTYHLTNSGSCSWFAFAREILRQSGWDVSVRAISTGELARPARRPAYSVLSLAGLAGTGVAVRPWEAALGSYLPRLRSVAPELFPEEEYPFAW